MVGSKLQAALAWARRGFKVFPLVPNGKEPVVAAFGTSATDDETIIQAWWRDPVTQVERDYNIGVLTTDIVVADIDVKSNKPGMATFQAAGGHFETLTVQTPTGGYHCYYNGPDSSLAPIGPGLDIRSHNGYVLAPGSTIDGVPYTVVVDQDMAWVPPGIESRLRAPGRRADRDESLVELDTPTAIDNAIAWVKFDAPLAVEGQGGDNTAYRVAAKLVRDYALTEETAFHLLVTHWNERCSPAWDAEELWRKVENAYQYGTGEIGAARPEATFGAVEVPEIRTQEFTRTQGFGNALDLTAIPPRPWLVKRLLMRRNITLLPAAGSSGKSVLSLTIAAHLAVGYDIGNYKTIAPCKSIIFNAEDDIEEQSRRLYAVCQEYKLDFEQVRQNIMLLSSDDISLCIAHSVNRQVTTNEQHVQAIIQAASAPDVGFVCLDPLVEIHNCDEQDNGQMRFVMAVLRRIAREADVSMLIPHHTSKPSGGATQHRAGNADVARGAGAIVNSARIVVTLFAATDQDRETYGISEEDKHRFVRLDDAKMNMTLASADSTWFRKVGARLYNGDEVGVMMFHDMRANEQAHREEIASILCEVLTATNAATISMKQATNALQEQDPLYARMTEVAARNKIEKALRSGVDTDFGRIICVREGDPGKEKVFVKIE